MESRGKWLLCRMGDLWYGLDLAHVHEIVYAPLLTGLPAMGRSVVGIMDWLGREITVVDPLGKDDRQPSADGHQGPKPVVVLHPGDSFLGLMVDEVGTIVSQDLGSGVEIDPLLTEAVGSVEAAFVYNDQIFFVINPQALQGAVC